MAYDHGLAERLEGIAQQHGLAAKKMFGGLGWLLNGNMCIGIYKDWLMLRVGEKTAALLLKEKYVKPMDITGKPMKGWLMVAPEGYSGDLDLERLTKYAVGFVAAMSAKE